MGNGSVGQWSRTLRPLFWWLLLVLVLYGYRLYQHLSANTHLDFAVTMNGQPLDGATAILDGQPIINGQWIAIGSHKFTLTHPKGESFSTNLFFSWYGKHDLGTINLPRSYGSLTIIANPPAPAITITGPEFSLTLHDSSGTNITVPTDQYEVHADYPNWSQSQNVAVIDKQITTCAFMPKFGALHLTSNHDGATYLLQFSNGQMMGSGDLPALLTGLPTGGYELHTAYHNHKSEQSVFVQSDSTNEIVAEFVLGAARIESNPSGADVLTTNGNYLGRTPLELPDITPHTIHLNVALSGYESVPLSLVVTADQTNIWHTNLISTRYVSAMREARASLAVTNYNAVMQATTEALNAMPDDVDALALQNEAGQHLADERQRIQAEHDAEQNRIDVAREAEHERLAQLKRPREAFDALCQQNPDATLFNEHEIKTDKPAKALSEALAKLLASEPRPFEILTNVSPKPNSYQIMARQTFSLGILGGTERDALIVVGQTTPSETQILFKVLEYQVKTTVDVSSLFNGKENKQMIPVSPTRLQINDALQRQLNNGVEMVTKRIEAAIGQVQ